MQIEIRVGDERFTALVDETPTGRDLLAQLPQTIEMSDNGGVEKSGRLQGPTQPGWTTSRRGPRRGRPRVLRTWQRPRPLLRRQSYYDGIVILRRLDSSATSRLAGLPGDITATVTVLDSSPTR